MNWIYGVRNSRLRSLSRFGRGWNGRSVRQPGQVGVFVVGMCLIAGACGGSEEGVGSEDEDRTVTPFSSISWDLPEDMEVGSIAVSSDGTQVALAFRWRVRTEMRPVEIIVFDISSGAEAWRRRFEDVGDFHLGDMAFTDAGVSLFLRANKQLKIVTLREETGAVHVIQLESPCSRTSVSATPPSEDVVYMLGIGGYCRVDLSTGDVVRLGMFDLGEDTRLLKSLRFDTTGNLVATYKDGNREVISIILSKVTLAPEGPANGEPPDLVDLYGEYLLAGPRLSDSNRMSRSGDGSTIVLLQSRSVDVLR